MYNKGQKVFKLTKLLKNRRKELGKQKWIIFLKKEVGKQDTLLPAKSLDKNKIYLPEGDIIWKS